MYENIIDHIYHIIETVVVVVDCFLHCSVVVVAVVAKLLSELESVVLTHVET